MDALNKWQYTLMVTLAFACLATYSYGEHGYDQREIDRVGELSMGGAAERKVVQAPPTNLQLMVYLYDEQGGKP